MQFLDIRVQLQSHYPAGYSTGIPDNDHLCCLASGATPIVFPLDLVFFSFHLVF